MLIYPTLKQSPIQGLIGVGGGASGYLVGSSFSYNDAAYSGFFSSYANPINIDNSTYNEYTGTAFNTHNALDFFIDHSEDKFFGGYSTASHYTWGNGGNNYAGNANFYTVGSQTDLAGQVSSGLQANGRGCTIGYLGDGTPVIIISTHNDNRFYFFNYPSGNYIGTKLVPTGTTNNPGGTNYMSGLAWDGTRLLMVNRNLAEVFGYNLPSNTSAIDGTSIGNASRRWVISHPCQYGMAWTGDGLIIGNLNSNQTATYFTLSGSGLSGTSTAVRTFSLGTTSYSLAIDYRNRKLVMGGYSNNKMRVWGE